MEIEKFDHGPRARVALACMITSTAVLAKVAPMWNGEMFGSSTANIIGGWCVDHYNRYGVAPNGSIPKIYEAWEVTANDKPKADKLWRLLDDTQTEVAGMDESANSAYLTDVVMNYFSDVKLSKTIKSAEAEREMGRLDKAAALLADYHNVKLGKGSGIDLLADDAAWEEAFSDNMSKSLIEYPGVLGSFFGTSLYRGGFVAVMAGEKIGKTSWLTEFAWQALTQRRRVAFFEIGDETRADIIKRFGVRMANHPIESNSDDGSWPCTIKIPTKIAPPPQRATPDEVTYAAVEYEERVVNHPMNLAMAKKARERVGKTIVRSGKTYFMLSVHSGLSINVDGIKAILSEWERDNGWVPDVIVIDYADNLAPPVGKLESRDQINKSWQQMRSLAQEKQALLITATQANRESYDRRVIDRRNISDDKRKLAHATAVFGINVYKEESEKQLSRLNWIVRRKGKYSTSKVVHVATCLALCRPQVVACF